MEQGKDFLCLGAFDGFPELGEFGVDEVEGGVSLRAAGGGIGAVGEEELHGGGI